jgi:hypothetical protein
MKNTFKYLALAAAMLFGFGACVEKAPEYEPADPVGNSEVFFAPTLPSSYNLKGNPGTFSFEVSRVDASSALTVNLSSTADAIFSVPSSVSFNSGAKSATVNVTFDPSQLVEDKAYPFVVKITNETTPYGASEYSFTASIPAAWTKFATGTLTEDWWGEVEPKKTLMYQDVGDHLRLCKIEACFGHDTGPTYDVQDYVFYWDTETNYLSIPMHYMGYTNGNNYKVYYGDAESFFRDVYGYDDDLMQRNGYASVADYAYNVSGYTRPYYDGNGGFYLASWYFFSKEDKAGSGYSFGDSVDIFICDGFVRVVDYNDEKHFGASSALYEGVMSSMMFSPDDEPVEFEQSLRYDADYEFDPETYDPAKDEIVTTTYYLKDYFGEDLCLAFTAPIPELLEDGSEITDVENEQNSGLKIMGHDLVVSIKKGSVSFPESEAEEDLFPTFNIVVKAVAKDADGNTEFEFGNLTEVFTALEYGKDGYTIDDLYGGYKEDYLGTWSMFSTEDGEEFNYDVEITDEGQDEAGNEIVKIKNLSGYDGVLGIVDELYATWSGYVLYVPGQTLENPAVYQGAEYTVQVYPADPDTQKYYGQTNTVLAGICADGALAFVNRYNGVNLSGFYYLLENLGGLTMFGNIYGFPANESSVGSVRNFFEEYKAGSVVGSAKTASVKVANTRLVKKSAASAAPARRVNISNFVKEPKNLGEIVAAPVK